MLNIEQPTLEEAGAAMLIAAVLDSVLPTIAKTPQAAFGMILMGSNPELDLETGLAMVRGACTLRDDLERIGRQTDELLKAALKSELSSRSEDGR
ncbi:MAG TPA: hypothetical protein PKG77_25235 [Phycisphaerae bacterium]|nr:hypothetical protein [Phycisphaerae bacterium]